jgi:hypothetical protein
VADVAAPANAERLATRALSTATSVDGVDVVWSRRPAGEIHLRLLRYPSVKAAQDDAEEIIQHWSADGIGAFGSIRPTDRCPDCVSTAAVSWIQSAGIGPMSDGVVAVLGDCVLAVEVSGLGASDDHSVITGLVREVLG